MKKTDSAFTILFITIIVSNIYYAQSNDNLNYFPHNDGDMWEYYYSDGSLYQDTAQVFNHYDSTDAHGNVFVTQTSRYINPIQVPAVPFADTMRYKIDTLNQVWGRVGELDSVIAFKLNAQPGDKWILETYYDNSELMGYEMAEIRTIYEQNYFGNLYTIMNTYYYFTPDTLSTEKLVRHEEEFAKSLGRIWLGGGESLGRMDLIGAVIDGVLYGDTTNVITSVQNNDTILPLTIKLEQNYPNPFNAGTTINFHLSQFSNITLIIYDIEGKEVDRLLNNNFTSPGKYSTYWDGQKVSSGVYFYSILQNSKPIKTKPMILLK